MNLPALFAGGTVSTRSVIGASLNRALRPLKVQVISGTSTDPAVKTFIPARKTIAAARAAGLSVSAYIDQTYVEPGVTPALVKAMLAIADLSGPCDTVCEIGAGSGRYAEEVIAALHPGAYEIYETAHDWLPVLRRLPNAMIRDCDGHTLARTADSSVDLVHAQKVFVYIPFFAAVGYIQEMARVVRPGGIVAFDVVTEDCLDRDTVHSWTREGTTFHPFPRAWTLAFLKEQGLTLRGSNFTSLPPGTSELLVFRKTGK
jgi:SAM-dependent methyltransferase